ncbi:MAG: D-2-hydroxyacid dehydrogenase [Actinobacteria bacterium]|nr:D-2-hydroxyacid dehydrogenase [Actinomycetota bacterium]
MNEHLSHHLAPCGRPASEGPVTVGLLYPSILHDRVEDYERQVAAWEAVDRRVRVLAVPYREPTELRNRRSSPGFERTDNDVTPVSDEVVEVLAEAEVLVALDLPFELSELAPKLRWVQAIGTGVGHLRSSGIPNERVQLTNAAGTASNEIAEFVIGRVLEHVKRFPDMAIAQRDHEWTLLYGSGLAGKTIALAGLGSINLAIARLAKAFGMRVVGMRRAANEVPPNVDEVFGPERFLEMLSGADAVVAALPGDSQTEGLFDKTAFTAMRPGAFFVNVGRGSSVVESALIAALESGRLSGAAIDVMRTEPLNAGNPLWTAPHLRISAHCSSVPSLSIVAVNELGRDNLARYLHGRPLLNVV